jgi:hypothetical protein
MKKSCLILLSIIFIYISPLYAADKEWAHNCLYVETFGQGILYSLNYEYMFKPNLSGRIGFTAWESTYFIFTTISTLQFIGGPVMVNYFIGNDENHLELGLGVLTGNANTNGDDLIFGDRINGNQWITVGTFTLGYRYQPKKGGFIFKVGLTPLFNTSDFKWNTGMSIGGAF